MDKKVFFVDDDEVTLFLYKRISKKLGVDAQFLENGQLLLDAITNENAGIIVLDINMPVLNGIQVVEALKEQNRLDQFTVLAMLGESSLDKKQQLADLGVTQFAEKPLKGETIQSLLEQGVSGN